MLDKWEQVAKDPKYWEYSPQERGIIKAQWFKQNIAPLPAFQSLTEEDKLSTLRGFANYGNDIVPDRSFLDVVKDLGVTAAKGVVGWGEAAVGIADFFTGGGAGNVLEKVAGYDPALTQQVLSEQYSPAQQAAGRKVEEAEGFLGTTKAMLENPSTIVHGAVETLPTMFGGGAIARGLIKGGTRGLLASAAGEGIASAGQSAEQIRQQTGGLGFGQSMGVLASGFGTGAFNMAGGRLARKLGFADVDSMVAGLDLNISNKNIVRRMVEGGVSEGLFEELPQSIQEQLWQNAALDKPLFEGAGAAGAQGAIIGALMGAGANIAARRQKETEITAAKTVDEAVQKFTEATAPEIGPLAPPEPQVPPEIANSPIYKAAAERQRQMDLEDFLSRIMAGEKMTDPKDLQFYENNKDEIESRLQAEVEKKFKFPAQTEQEQAAMEADILAQREKAQRTAAERQWRSAQQKAGLLRPSGAVAGTGVDLAQQRREVDLRTRPENLRVPDQTPLPETQGMFTTREPGEGMPVAPVSPEQPPVAPFPGLLAPQPEKGPAPKQIEQKPPSPPPATPPSLPPGGGPQTWYENEPGPPPSPPGGGEAAPPKEKPSGEDKIAKGIAKFNKLAAETEKAKQKTAGTKAAADFNEAVPGHDLKFDGILDRSAIGKPPLYNFTAYAGPLDKGSLTTEEPTVEAVRKKLESMIGQLKPKEPEKNIKDYILESDGPVTIEQLKNEGYGDRKIANATYILQKEGKIERVDRHTWNIAKPKEPATDYTSLWNEIKQNKEDLKYIIEKAGFSTKKLSTWQRMDIDGLSNATRLQLIETIDNWWKRPGKVMPSEIARRVKKASELGKAAFKAGKKAVPAQDPELVKLLKGLTAGEGFGDVTKAWAKAFNEANAAEPVPGVNEISKQSDENWKSIPGAGNSLRSTFGDPYYIISGDPGQYRVTDHSNGNQVGGTYTDVGTAKSRAMQHWLDKKKKTPEKPARREPWQMTKREYQLSKALGDPPILNARDGDVHKNLVTMAVNEGKPVPERVLDSYPWLKKKAPEKKTAKKSEFSKADERLIESLKAQGKSGIKYDETVEIEETGQTVTYPQDVSEMFTEIDEKAEAYNKIMDCIAA
jgi:hypothetical protein